MVAIISRYTAISGTRRSAACGGRPVEKGPEDRLTRGLPRHVDQETEGRRASGQRRGAHFGVRPLDLSSLNRPRGALALNPASGLDSHRHERWSAAQIKELLSITPPLGHFPPLVDTGVPRAPGWECATYTSPPPRLLSCVRHPSSIRRKHTLVFVELGLQVGHRLLCEPRQC